MMKFENKNESGNKNHRIFLILDLVNYSKLYCPENTAHSLESNSRIASIVGKIKSMRNSRKTSILVLYSTLIEKW